MRKPWNQLGGRGGEGEMPGAFIVVSAGINR